MTGEEMERAVEFLLQSQANSEARIARLEAAQGETNRQLQQGTHQLQQNTQQIGDLVSVQQRAQQQLDQVIGIVAELVEGRRSTRDDIDALVKIAGGIIGGRDGGANRGR